MTRLLNFTRTQKKRREERVFMCAMEWRRRGRGLDSSDEENMNGMTFNEG